MSSRLHYIAPPKRSPNAKTATTISTELTTQSINQSEYQSTNQNLHKALLTGVTNAEAETRQKAMVIRVRIMVATDVVVITVIKIYK